MDGTVSDADTYVEDQYESFLADLFELLSQPSISATGEGVDECTALVEEYCLAYGFDDVCTVTTRGHPAVIAHAHADTGVSGGTGDEPGLFEDSTAGSGEISAKSDDAPGKSGDVPTVLLYGHYDVQPVTPEEWESPPFEPTRRAGPDGRERIYARGAGDNKGQWFTHLCAVRALREAASLPTNVVLLLEGEEESGSPNLDAVVREHAEELSADLAYVADGPIDASGRPHVLMGARGMVYVQIDAYGPDRDLHSGNYGGPIPNPAWELVRLIGSMKDDAGRVTIEGFYDDVRPITDVDRRALAEMPFDAEAVLADLDLAGFADGPGDAYLEKLMYYPTLNVAGFTSGYGGEGTKTIIPARAKAKLDMRLVADQDPDDVFQQFADHVEEHASDAVEVDVTRLGAMAPQRTPLDHPVREPLVAAVEDAWESAPILKTTLGGSLPTAVFADHLDVPCVVVPYANSDENNHSPDENLSLWCFRNGIKTTTRVLDALAASAP